MIRLAFFLFISCALAFISCQPQPDRESQHTDSLATMQDTIDQLTLEVQTHSESPHPYHERAKFYYNHQTYGEAIRDLIRCTELDSSAVQCWHMLADAYINDNRSRPAIEALEDYLRIKPKHIPSLLKIAEFQTIIKRYKAAHFNLNTVLKIDRANAQALFAKGLIYRYEEKPLQAVQYLQEAVQSDPDLVDAHLLLGEQFEDVGNPLAKKFYENARRVAPDHPEAAMALANYYWRSDEYPMALESYEGLLKVHPKFFRGYYNRGLMYLELDSIESAQADLLQAVQISPRFSLAHYYLSEAYVLQDKWEEAKSHIDLAYGLAPSHQKTQQRRIEIYEKLNLN